VLRAEDEKVLVVRHLRRQTDADGREGGDQRS